MQKHAYPPPPPRTVTETLSESEIKFGVDGSMFKPRRSSDDTAGHVKAGVCRPCDTIELTATSCNFSLCRRVEKVCVDRQLFRYSWSRS